MTESKNSNTQSRPRSSANGTKARPQAAAAASATEGFPTVLPAPLAEKTAAAAQALRGSVGRAGWIWTAIRARKALAAGAATAGAAALTTAYTLGHRSGRRTRGPLSRLTGGRI
ncbi:hypothetical protein ABZ716_13810 [Streptomyces sp. NPDC006687]|uniref:hypothetical protein n=1 Tax=unclassified Streptomyces TaxID=2593676 RepID=UPI0033CF2DD6